MKILKYIVFTLILACFYYVVLAQHPEIKRATHWYFGNGAGLDFSSGSPVADTNGAVHTYEGCATISDTAGNLLFYTDGDTIWNKNHQPMPNGTGLMGCPLYGSSAQAALIIPQPNNDSLYYVFTTDCFEDAGIFGLRYSIVNMNLNGGLGDIITVSKNTLLYTPCTEGLTATYNCENTTIWVMSHEYNTNNFVAYKIDSNGLNTIPVISSIGSSYFDYFAYMRFSPNSKFFASTFSSFSVSSELFRFNQNDGSLSNLISIPLFSGDYGTSFSSDNSKLYFTLGGADIYQFDISNYNQSAITNSKIQIDTTDTFILGAISNGIDGKLYVATLGEISLGTISSPNSNGSSSNLNLQNVLLNGSLSSLGLPDFVQSYFNTSAYENCLDTIYANNSATIIIPNIFTPNNDGFNDVFSITLHGYEQLNYRIYNRWGDELKFGELKIENDGRIYLWDGRTNAGVKVHDGIYYYIINLTNKRNEYETKKGFIQVLN